MDYLPDCLTFEGTIADPVSSRDRLAPAQGQVADVLLAPGAPIRRGATVLTVTGVAYIKAQEEIIRAFREGSRPRAGLDLAAPIREGEEKLVQLKFSRDQIAWIRQHKRVIDPLPILSPFDAVLTGTLQANELFAEGASLFSIAIGRLVKFRISSKYAQYLRNEKEAKVTLSDGTEVRGRFESFLVGEGDSEGEGRLICDRLLAPAGDKARIEFHFDGYERATPTCTRADWPYSSPPRGSDLVRLQRLHANKTGGALPQQVRPTSTVLQTSQLAVPDFRPRRPLARHADPDLPPAPSSQRHSISLSLRKFTELKIRTTRIEPTPIIPRWRCLAQVMECAPPQQPFHVSAAYDGTFLPAPIRRDDVVNPGQPIGHIHLHKNAIEDQQALLAASHANDESPVRERLHGIGFTDQDIAGIKRKKLPITLKEVYATSSGVVQDFWPSERLVKTGETILILRCTNMQLVRAHIAPEEYELIPRIVHTRLSRPFLPNSSPVYASSALNSERSRTDSRVDFDLAFPCGTEFLAPGGIFELELSDPTSSRQGKCIPRDCVLQLGLSNEVLIYSRGAVLTPAAVVLGKARDSVVEVLGGISAGQSLVRDLKDLVNISKEIYALMGGFWTPPSG
jgi:biotin carboxyl carrier protein